MVVLALYNINISRVETRNYNVTGHHFLKKLTFYTFSKISTCIVKYIGYDWLKVM